MRLFKMTSLVSPVPASDFTAALRWYETIFGPPDEAPMPNMAEWQIGASAWLQLDGNAPGDAGKAAVLIGVEDIAACRQALLQAGIAAGEVVDYGVAQVCDTCDPHGNRLSFVQVMA